MDIIVRKYEEKDLAAVNRMLYEAFHRTKNNITGAQFCELVVQLDSKVVGYLLLTKVLNPILNRHYYLIDYVCIVREYRGLGLGDKLLAYAEEYARNDGAIYLQLTCRWTRIEAHKLYEKCGFKKRESDIFRKELI